LNRQLTSVVKIILPKPLLLLVAMRTFTTLQGQILVLILLSILRLNDVFAQNPPAGFASTVVSSGWNEAVGLTFNQSGTDMFVWERGGRVWVVINNQRSLILDISEEVGGWNDHGLLGLALHPQFDQNGYFYIMYLVDRHHLMNFGTPNYNPATNDYSSATIGRVTRYTATKTGNTYSVNLSSRRILIGQTKENGIVSTERSHVTGALVFGTDNTLLVSTGDGASAAAIDTGSNNTTYFAQALSDGILTTQLNIGSFRSQLLESLNGKILRINPENGQGISSNPFYDPARPDATISKVWALGIRQPFRMSVKQGTGSHNVVDGNPGVIYFGDVGFNSWEELNVVDRPGLNFGWPMYEGLEAFPQFVNTNTPNYYTPNPLYQQNGCTQQYFYFQNLLKPATPTNTATFTNPCNSSVAIPPSVRTFVHTRPIIDWLHLQNGPARTGIFNGNTPGVINVGAAGSPVSGPQFGGSAAVGGVFYQRDDFPEPYRNTYFFGDYGRGWIKSFTMDQNDRPVQIRDFVNTGAIVVALATHPSLEGLYYVNFPSEIRRIYRTANKPPVAVASANVLFGTSPLTVQFTGNTSQDPESQPLTYEWNFGDGTALSTQANPTHVFNSGNSTPTRYTVTLKVRDNLGVENQTTLNISVNNTPPQVQITSPVDGELYPITGETVYPLRATVTDAQHSGAQLNYQWQTILHHNTHQHPEPVVTLPETTTTISPLGCDGETYSYVIRLIVTDAVGASTTREVRLYPNCGGPTKITPLITWANPAAITADTPLSATQLNATATNNGSPVPGIFTYTPSAGTVLPAGAGQTLSVNFAPTDGTTYNSATKTVTITVNSGSQTSTFYRAININGAALAIDGNNWISSTGAPNFSFTTNNDVFSDQTVPLIPSTDANRATMIRSSVYGNTITANMTAVPAGSYQVYLYVWEDNEAQIYSVSLEGAVVLANFNSGPAGTWTKLGPFAVTINDGAINLSTSGGHCNLSGIEVWTAGAPPANQPPVVANAIPNQMATMGATFNYTFPVNTFTDPNAGTTLTYTAALEAGGALPAWLTFTSGSRNFAGTPAAANIGTINVRVTASDGQAGGTVSDVFTLTVNKATPVINWANPASIVAGTALSGTQLNATATYNGSPVPGTLTYTPPAGTVLAVGAAQQLSVNFVPTDGNTYNAATRTVTIDVNSTSSATLYRAININGPALVIDGNNWVSSTGAPNFSFTTNNTVFNDQSVPLIPSTDANRATMIRSSVYGNTINVNMTGVPAGPYQVYLYVWEDNAAQIYSVSLEGSVVRANFNSGPAGTWTKLGPYSVTINDGAINISTSGGHCNLSGIEVWTAGAPPANQPPVVANAIPNQTATAATVFSYTFPLNTFTDPNAGTTLTYTAALENGSSLPSWLTFTPGTRTFSGTAGGANVGAINIRVTASDGQAGDTVSDIFALTVNKATPVITWPNPAPIVSGTPLSATQLNATAAYNGSPVTGAFTYTPPSGTVLPVGANQQLSVSFVPTDGATYNSVNFTTTITVNSTTPTATFYRAININGAALVIDGNNWVSSTGAPNFSFTTNNSVFANQGVTLIPSTDANRATMIRSSVYGNTVNANMSAVPAGSYQVYLYVWEDNFAQTYSISLEGSVVVSNLNSGPTGTWRKLGPYNVTINDGAINISTSGGHCNLSGVEVWGAATPSGRLATVAAPEILVETTMTGKFVASPNPFSKQLNISFTAEESGVTKLELYDVKGVKTHIIYNGFMQAGEGKELQYESKELSDGVYVLQLINGKKITRLKLLGMK
jgi:glucose/arabinose dehydrogenase